MNEEDAVVINEMFGVKLGQKWSSPETDSDYVVFNKFGSDCELTHYKDGVATHKDVGWMWGDSWRDGRVLID